jgi:galactokinase
MTGGGFGGCTVNLVKSDGAATFKAHVAQAYAEATGITPEVYGCDPGFWPTKERLQL